VELDVLGLWLGVISLSYLQKKSTVWGGRLTPADSKEARDISDEWVVLVDMSGS